MRRIRDLVGTARHLHHQDRPRMIEAKAKLRHGEWSPWLEAEFGWHEVTARRYMQVANAFKSNTVFDLDAVTIGATALYALSAPDVPQTVREQAVEQAQAGKHKTVWLKLPAPGTRCRGRDEGV